MIARAGKVDFEAGCRLNRVMLTAKSSTVAVVVVAEVGVVGSDSLGKSSRTVRKAVGVMLHMMIVD